MIESWFPTLILSEDLSDNFGKSYNEQVYMMAKQYQKTHVMTTGWICDTFNTVGIPLTQENIFQDLIKVTKFHVMKLSEEYKILKGYSPNLLDLWINISPPGEYQEYHTHTNSHFSIVYYVKTPKNCGNIIFRPISSWVNQKELSIYEEGFNSSSMCNYSPRESLLLVFKSELPHMVMKNKSDEDRVSISMNFEMIR